MIDIVITLISLFLTPPLLYVTLALVGLCILSALYAKFKESIDPVIFAILDVLAFIVVTFVSICKAIFRCIQRISYPIKQCCFWMKDTIDFKVNPWKKRVPYTHIPTFS